MRISDWSSDVCSSDLGARGIDIAGKRVGTGQFGARGGVVGLYRQHPLQRDHRLAIAAGVERRHAELVVEFRIANAALRLGRQLFIAPSSRLRCVCRSEEHTSELQSLMRISYAVFCLKKKKYIQDKTVHKDQ